MFNIFSKKKKKGYITRGQETLTKMRLKKIKKAFLKAEAKSVLEEYEFANKADLVPNPYTEQRVITGALPRPENVKTTISDAGVVQKKGYEPDPRINIVNDRTNHEVNQRISAGMHNIRDYGFARAYNDIKTDKFKRKFFSKNGQRFYTIKKMVRNWRRKHPKKTTLKESLLERI